ncbi:Catechol O-methyltransferase [Durusdinium trenchii]|uniref:Catechol O-methyltransferase n=1 Tax=Durusdinium trenchii TaxID=1381693 RepID=A0ABP0KQU8_9DINO
MAASPSHSVQLVQFVLGWLDPSWFAEAGDWHLLRTLGHSLGSSTTGQSSGAGASDTIVLGPGGADNVLKPGAPRYLWQVCRSGAFDTEVVRVFEFAMPVEAGVGRE